MLYNFPTSTTIPHLLGQWATNSKLSRLTSGVCLWLYTTLIFSTLLNLIPPNIVIAQTISIPKSIVAYFAKESTVAYSTISKMEKTQLVFIPAPGLSHLVSTVEIVKLLLDRDERLSITVLIMTFREDPLLNNYIHKISSHPNNSSSRLRFIDLPKLESNGTQNSKTVLFSSIDNQITPIRDIISNLINEDGPKLGGLVLDMFCTEFIDLAKEFNMASYVFFTSGACALGLFSHVVNLKFEQNEELTVYKDSKVELSVPCFSIPVPAKVLPAVFVGDSTMAEMYLNYFKRIPECKGIMVNTFFELEKYSIESFMADDKFPKVYPVGPILSSGGGDEYEKQSSSYDEIMKWLDEQSENSVVFLCFGTMGTFDAKQVKEIASALENSGQRFLWSLRKPGERSADTTMLPPTEYEDFQEVLPDGFLERTKGVGRVIGWAPQVKVLSHPSVGGFVSHCGWNSTLESICCGVPMATFPLYAEQQVNAFELVKELGIAEPIRIDYKQEVIMSEKPSEIVSSEEIDSAIRRLMVEESGKKVRRKVKEMQKMSNMTLQEGGSSYKAQNLFIEDVIKNIS